MNSLFLRTEDHVEHDQLEPSLREALASASAGESVGVDLKPLTHREEGRWIKPNLNPGRQYGIAVISTLTAFLLRLSIDAFLGDEVAYGTFILAVTLTTWYGGVGASVTAAVLGALLTNWFFIQPRYEFSLTGPVDQAGMAVYVTVCFALVGFIHTWGWAWKKTDEMTEQLRQEMNRREETEESSADASTESLPVSTRES